MYKIQYACEFREETFQEALAAYLDEFEAEREEWKKRREGARTEQ